MENETVTLCGSNAYKKKYYLNKLFSGLPDQIKKDLQILCVLFTEEVGGIFLITFDETGCLHLETSCAEDDFLYDKIGSELKIKRLQTKQRQLWESLETYYRTFFLSKEVQ